MSQETINDVDENVSGFFKLIHLNDEQFNNFKNKLNEFMVDNNYENSNVDFIFENDCCECNITKKNIPNWHNTIIYNNSSNFSNETHHRIVIFKYQLNTYYIEKNGSINISSLLENILISFERKKWLEINTSSILFNEKIKKYIDSINNNENKLFLKMYENNINDSLLMNELCETINDYQNDCHVTEIDTLISIYNSIPKLHHNKKLIEYDYSDCILNCKNGTTKSTETKYNANVHEKMQNHYLLDCILIKGCEIADIYNNNDNIFFHNKKSNDLRVLCFQIMISSLILKNSNYFYEYDEILKCKNIFLNIDTNSFKFVAGIIKTTSEIHFKDKIALAITYEKLKKMGIELYIDEINVINFPEIQAEPKLKKESKSKKEPKLKKESKKKAK